MLAGFQRHVCGRKVIVRPPVQGHCSLGHLILMTTLLFHGASPRILGTPAGRSRPWAAITAMVCKACIVCTSTTSSEMAVIAMSSDVRKPKCFAGKMAMDVTGLGTCHGSLPSPQVCLCLCMHANYLRHLTMIHLLRLLDDQGCHYVAGAVPLLSGHGTELHQAAHAPHEEKHTAGCQP